MVIPLEGFPFIFGLLVLLREDEYFLIFSPLECLIDCVAVLVDVVGFTCLREVVGDFAGAEVLEVDDWDLICFAKAVAEIPSM